MCYPQRAMYILTSDRRLETVIMDSEPVWWFIVVSDFSEPGSHHLGEFVCALLQMEHSNWAW